jgi:hypothetical protein
LPRAETVTTYLNEQRIESRVGRFQDTRPSWNRSSWNPRRVPWDTSNRIPPPGLLPRVIIASSPPLLSSSAGD